MAIHLKCTGCRSSLKLGEKLAGEKVQCPRCQKLISVPEVEDDSDLVECMVEEERVTRSPRRGERNGRIQREAPRARKQESVRRDEVEDELPRRKSKKQKPSANEYQPCPECGGEEAERVPWTAWGSFYGPALFTHVQCPECGTCYNGKTGRSNLLAAVIFVTMPLVGILAIIAGILYVVAQRGHMG